MVQLREQYKQIPNFATSCKLRALHYDHNSERPFNETNHTDI